MMKRCLDARCSAESTLQRVPRRLVAMILTWLLPGRRASAESPADSAQQRRSESSYKQIMISSRLAMHLLCTSMLLP